MHESGHALVAAFTPDQRRERRQPREYLQQGQGSGFIVSKDGYILTNHHMVGETDRITVTLADDREFEAKLIGTDAKSDVAVIKINGDNFPVLPIGNSDRCSDLIQGRGASARSAPVVPVAMVGDPRPPRGADGDASEPIRRGSRR